MAEKEKAPSFGDAEVRLGGSSHPPAHQPEYLTPEQWARRKGLFVEAKFPGESRFDWTHCSAAALHGWAAHEHHAGGPIKLTEAQYDAAIKAVAEPDPKTGQSAAYKPAMSPYCPHDGGHAKG